MSDQIANIVQVVVYALVGGGSILYALNRFLARRNLGRFRQPSGRVQDSPDG